MSNSARAKARRSKQSKMSKHQRSIMASQHFGDSQGVMRPTRQERDESFARLLGLGKEK